MILGSACTIKIILTIKLGWGIVIEQMNSRTKLFV